jgi:hypothetical protein
MIQFPESKIECKFCSREVVREYDPSDDAPMEWEHKFCSLRCYERKRLFRAEAMARELGWTLFDKIYLWLIDAPKFEDITKEDVIRMIDGMREVWKDDFEAIT